MSFYSSSSRWGTKELFNIKIRSGARQKSRFFYVCFNGESSIFVSKYASNGSLITKWRSSPTSNAQNPQALSIDLSDNIYVAYADAYPNDYIQKFTSDGSFITGWGTKGTGDGQFSLPSGIAVDESGNIYVSDIGNCRIQKFAPVNPVNCAATLSNDLSLNIPVINFNNQAYYWADFSYVPNTMDFTLIDAGVVSDTSPFTSCSPSTLSTDFKLHVPTITFGNAFYWADFQYAHDLIFTLTGAGQN